VLFVTSLAVFAAVLSTGMPLLVGYGIDSAVSHRPVVWIAAALVAWLAARLASDRLTAYLDQEGDRLGEAICQGLRVQIISQLLDKPISFHDGAKGREIESLLDVEWRLSVGARSRSWYHAAICAA
jgi:hypothetical protein